MNKTLQEQYNLIKEGKGNKQQFFKSARHIFPDLVTPVNTFEDAVVILKNRGIISESIGGLVTKGTTPDWHKIFRENITEEAKKVVNAKQNGDKSYTVEYSDGTTKKIAVSNDAWDEINDKYGKLTETKDYKKGDKVKFTNKTWTVTNTYVDGDGDKFYDIELNGKTHKEVPVTALKEAKEAKAEEKEPTKDVVDMETKGYDYKDKKNYDNVFGEEFLKGFYTEMGDSKNEGKTVEELRAIVAKNLAKDINHYVKDGQFGVKGVGYTTEAPVLGTPKEAKGKHKSSGYGDLKENKDPKAETKFYNSLKTGDKAIYDGPEKNGFMKGDKVEVVRSSSGSTFQNTLTVKKGDKKLVVKGHGSLKPLNESSLSSLKESVLRALISEMVKEVLAEALRPEDKETFSVAVDVAEKLYDEEGSVEAALAKLPAEYASFKDELEQHLTQKFEG